MELHTIVAFAREFLVLIFVFGALVVYAVVRGRRSLMSLVLGLYIALLVSLKFPYYERVYALLSHSDRTHAILTILIFAVFAAVATILFERLLSHEFEESPFEGISKKVVLAVLATVLIFAYSYHVLPVTSLIDPGSSIGQLFAPEEYFFWMLIVPFISLFVL